jgi:hypothetical protein
MVGWKKASRKGASKGKAASKGKVALTRKTSGLKIRAKRSVTSRGFEMKGSQPSILNNLYSPSKAFWLPKVATWITYYLRTKLC